MFHTVTVGEVLNSFNPTTITAAPGDIVQFNFYPANHSVVRAQFGSPCIPFDYVGDNTTGGFFSGMNALERIPLTPPSWNLTINDTSPILFYCSAPGSCDGHGMVGVINPNATQMFSQQQALALSAGYSLSPGQPFPGEQSVSPSPTALDVASSKGPTTTAAQLADWRHTNRPNSPVAGGVAATIPSNLLLLEETSGFKKGTGDVKGALEYATFDPTDDPNRYKFSDPRTQQGSIAE
ncbi:hypothetical protein LTR56_024283 [Elasticomyces elasticus]|nr:hypothetical protein LTR56_024283 [Elasticomyces elasticus]KAK4905900.1 hypothetical protein LTR49_024870 [Elasticomyces elasticus]